MWDKETGTIIRTFSGHTSSVYSVAISPDGNLILASGGTGRSGDYEVVKLWDAQTVMEIHTFGHKGGVQSVEFSPEGKHVLTGSAVVPTGGGYDTVRIWDISDLTQTSGISSEKWMMY